MVGNGRGNGRKLPVELEMSGIFQWVGLTWKLVMVGNFQWSGLTWKMVKMVWNKSGK